MVTYDFKDILRVETFQVNGDLDCDGYHLNNISHFFVSDLIDDDTLELSFINLNGEEASRLIVIEYSKLYIEQNEDGNVYYMSIR